MIYYSIGKNERQERINFNLIKRHIKEGDIYLKEKDNDKYLMVFGKKSVKYFACQLDFFEIEDKDYLWQELKDEELIKEIFNGLWMQDI